MSSSTGNLDGNMAEHQLCSLAILSFPSPYTKRTCSLGYNLSHFLIRSDLAAIFLSNSSGCRILGSG